MPEALCRSVRGQPQLLSSPSLSYIAHPCLNINVRRQSILLSFVDFTPCPLASPLVLLLHGLTHSLPKHLKDSLHTTASTHLHVHTGLLEDLRHGLGTSLGVKRARIRDNLLAAETGPGARERELEVREERALVPELGVLLDLESAPCEVLSLDQNSVDLDRFARFTHHLGEVVAEEDGTVRLCLLEKRVTDVSLHRGVVSPPHAADSLSVAGVPAKRANAQNVVVDSHADSVCTDTECGQIQRSKGCVELLHISGSHHQTAMLRCTTQTACARSATAMPISGSHPGHPHVAPHVDARSGKSDNGR